VTKDSRSGLVDALKGVACATIVLHHLSSYGPMADVAHPLAPDLLGFLYNYGRLAVQVFLVIAGFMAAASLAPQGIARFDNGWTLFGRRYARLALPYFVALTAAIWAANLARHVGHSDSVPVAASVGDVVVHMLMLQDVVGVGALSAGAWYLSIDLQLFGLTILVLWAARSVSAGATPEFARLLTTACVALACGVSLLWFNRKPELDITAIYFFGSYGFGLLTYWAVHASNARSRSALLVVVVALGIAALIVEFRERIALALAVALLLWVTVQSALAQRLLNSQHLGPLRYLGRISYSVFLIHYPVLLVFNAFMGQLFLYSHWANAIGMFAAFACSVAVADQMYRHIENLPLSRFRFVLLAAPLFVVTAIAH
jgi:peptidoglycan/LPS O-acetylase OafA/YrhL